MTAKERVMRMLLDWPTIGISVANFQSGFRLAARICELRQLGYKIENKNPVGIARYVLVQEVKSSN